MVNCSILGCRSRTERKEPNITFHLFPTEIPIRNLWIRMTGRPDWQPSKNARVCSKHFKTHCFRKTRSLTYITKDSVPTLFLPKERSMDVDPILPSPSASSSNQNIATMPPLASQVITVVMLKMSQLENIINAYKTISKIPSVIGGSISGNGKRITSKWSVRNLDKGKTTKYLHNYMLDDSLNVVSESEFGTDVSNELLFSVSPRETFKAVIREEKDSKDAKKQYLEVWSRRTLAHSIDLTALELHGDVYADSVFGCLDWSHDESMVVYVAEKKLKKSEPYIKRKGDEKTKQNGSGEAAPKKGEEHIYRQDWGEQLVGKHLSVVVVCRLDTETCTVLEGLPDSWCPGQVVFTPDDKAVVGVAWETEPRRLGLIFCTNRPGFIFELTLDGSMRRLSDEGMAVRSPLFVPNGDLLWLQRLADGPHHACHALVAKKKESNEITKLIDVVDTSVPIANGGKFYGIYATGLPQWCFAKDGKRIVFSTPQQNEVRSYVLDIENDKLVDISRLEPMGSTTVLDVHDDVILASYSNMKSPSQLIIARLPSPGEEDKLQWKLLSEPSEVPSSLKNSHVEHMFLKHDTTDKVNTFTALYLAPAAEEGKKLPLIVWPHGGPHSGFVDSFGIEAALFNMLGFAILQINYRGSTGTGQASVYYLPKNVGDADVKDCKYATDEAIKRFPIDSNKLFLVGGSHGGFLVTHLSGQYPDMYKAVVTRNPVTDVASMFNSTDIADCGAGDESLRCLNAHCGEYDVEDALLALTTLLERDRRLDERNVLLFGGSYGGFLIGHLAGRYPNTFRAMVMRNPLIDLATKINYADNPDGCTIEAGYPFTEQGPVSEDLLLAMRRCSPLAHVHKVRAPTALMLGTGDKRVPMYQGLEYSRRLKANGVPVRVYVYDDNHSLSSLPNEMDNCINSASWFFEHMQS